MIRIKIIKGQLERFFSKRLAEIDRQLLARMRILGEMCVNMSRGEGNNNPDGFPVSYAKNGKPLKQRQITQADRDKNPYVVAPQFGDHLDWTGNLNASIGYFIVRDGKIIDENPGTEEVAASRRVARKTAGGRKGYVLVVVAGSSYAAAVEAKGFDVITSSELWAEKEAAKILKKFVKK